MTTVQEIVTLMYSQAKKIGVGNITIEDAQEGPPLVRRAMLGLFLFAARANPGFFGDAPADVAPAAGGWPRPACLAIARIELALTGAKVTPVPYDQRDADPGNPCVYEWGQKFYPAGNASDPDPAAHLRMFCTKSPKALAALGDTLDPAWVMDFDTLLALECAIFATLKDERPDEYLAALKAERDTWALRFWSFLEGATVGLTRRDDPPAMLASTVPAGALLAGGSAVKG